MVVSHKIHLSSRRIRREHKLISSPGAMVMPMTMAEERRIVTEAEIAKETEIREVKVMAEEEIAEGNQEKIQVRIPKYREIVLDPIGMAGEVEMANGFLEADRDQEVGHTLTSPGADNLGMKKSKEVGQALKIEQERNGADPDLATMIEIIEAGRNIILIVRTPSSIREEITLKIRDEAKVRAIKKVKTLIEIDMIENCTNLKIIQTILLEIKCL